VAAARADLYKQMDERRKAADGYRKELVAQTKADVDAQLAGAKAELEAQTAEAKARLEAEAEQLGRDIASKVLGRPS
jgi:F0F1-type ATP synthase membrane subunit b/b'